MLQLAVPPLTQPFGHQRGPQRCALTLIGPVTCSASHSHCPKPSRNCHSCLTSQSFTPDLPSTHIHGQVGLLKSSTLPALEAAAISSELPQPPSLSPDLEMLPASAFRGLDPEKKKADSHSWVMHLDIVTSEPHRENCNVFRPPHVTTALGKAPEKCPAMDFWAQVLLKTSGFIQSWGYTIQMPAWAPAGLLRPS